MAELAVDGNAEDFAILAGEIGVTVAESRDLRGAHEGEIQGIEEQHHVFAAVLGQGDLLELLIDHSGGGEIGGLMAHAQRGHVGDARVGRKANGARRSRSDFHLH